MKAAELVQAGRLDEALPVLQEQIRANPGDSRLRIFLFQLYCVLGRLDRALVQLQAIASLDAQTELMAQIFRPVITCELLRRDVFAGKRSPVLFGEPEPWMSWLVQANSLIAKGEYVAAAELRDRAFEAAPATPGTMDGQPIAWIADADSRLGPMLEVILEGKYFWVPFQRVKRIDVTKPSDLRDLVWLPVRVTWTNGGEVSAHLPARYPGTEETTDGPLRLGRKTEWREPVPGTFLGTGQRLLATDAGEVPVLDLRALELTTPVS